MTNGSPCPGSEHPDVCNKVGSEIIDGRPATEWELVNHIGERIYLWTDDQLEIAVKWEIETTTYELKNIRHGTIANNLFELPTGYSELQKRFP